MELSTLMTAATAAAVLLSLYLYRVNQLWTSVPQEALDYSPHRWTDDEILKTYERVCREPIDFKKVLPPKLERRYVVVGGSGLVGGDIVLHLLLRGQPPSCIRIADFNPPARADLLEGAAAEVDFAQTDITDPSSVEAAFARPWPASAAHLPLTVFHTAATIRPAERSPLLWERTRGVNVDGTRHSLAAARAAGADVFVFTSSVSVALRPCAFFPPLLPWRAWARARAPHSYPRRWFQVLDEADFDAPVRGRDEFFSNYALSKALSERLVAAANGPALRTGCVRPGNGIYGMPRDVVFADFLRRGDVLTFGPRVIQNVVSSRNVSLAHLDFEAALAPRKKKQQPGGGSDGDGDGDGDGDMLPACAGRPFVVTDRGAPPGWADFFRAARLVSSTPFSVRVVPPLPLYLVSVAVEAWSLLLARLPRRLTAAPLLGLLLREPRGNLRHLQPAVFTPTAFVMCRDERARRAVRDGGIGYEGALGSLEGVCELLRDWNREQEAERARRKGPGAAGAGGKGGEGGGRSILEADLAAKAVAA